MKFGHDLVTGLERYMTSWKSPGDPSPEVQLFKGQDWNVSEETGGDICARFELCGPYGSCSMNRHPPCSCMEGFEPIFPQEWEASDWSRGCQRKVPLICGSEYGFKKVSGVKLPDTRKSWYNHSMTLGECDLACRNNCSCMAYANLDSRNGGSGCLIWFDELRDIAEFDDGDTIYIRMATTELAGHESHNRKEVLTFVLPILSATLLVSAVAQSCIKRKKMLHMKKQGELEYALAKKNTSTQTENLDDIQFFSLYKVVKATNNFSDSNKVGEGGFGPVYKGVLENGQEVAVKRLSETSHQGFDEFKNELISVARLQHRNLVKLLGYCIHENEMILIYEYMANKSLDSFIFDETKSSMLDWPHRFHIIHGMARGILYLHQDSRLQIIHRDLKAGNILLDSDWNPKISDFGLARMFVGQDASAKTKKVVGTYGYISPEYAVHGRFSVKSDVFSFGVMVLEIISGMKNRDFCHEDHRDNLLGHVRIIHETTAPYTPQQNGVAERKNKALKKMVNSMLSYSGWSEGFWGEAMAIVRLPDPKRKTLGEKGIDYIFVGYVEHSKAYRFYVIEPNDSVFINSIIKSRDAIFDENRFSLILRPKDIIPNSDECQRDDHSDDVLSEILEPRKGKRVRKAKSYGSDFQLYLVEGSRDQVGSQYSYCYSIEEDPITYNKAMQSRDSAFWKEAIDDEIGSIMENNTWVLSDLPLGCKPLGCKWIFKRKMKVDGTINKFKARLVIQGFRQKEGIDYFDTYAPVARITTIRLLLALAAIHNLVIHQMDVKTTFLNGDLDEEVYMKQPEGFVMPGYEHKMCKLVK
ncbi:G-type lectin S-receptor-like serine/threonine-protein kinase [Tanacetum coccineum]|uniref:G-type lectin S-receptor-like serine/threonine-protein kinase n=1 Tax=Tanacetum coccineum TaxID=301880 RepID=A0ABQ4ZKZ3_9ASTR